MSTLAVEGLTRTFDGLVAVSNLSFEVSPARITALIGPNGAGKTTIFNMISGLIRPTAGRISFDGRDITRRLPHEICRAGIGRSFQTPHTFGQMTVLENVMVAAQVRAHVGFLATGLRFAAAVREEARLRDAAMRQLELFGLAALAQRRAATLPLGQQRLLELARALATEPKLLMLDEPAAGLTQAEVLGLREALGKIRAKGLTVFLVEHNMRFVLRTADQVIVLNFGQKLAQGPPEEIARDERVIAAYLGRTAEHSRATG